MGRLNAAANTTTGVSLSVAYNNMNLPSTVTYGTGGDVRSFSYDALERVHTDQLKTSGGASVASITYGYDTASNETSKTTVGVAGASSNVYTYDLANRLLSWNNGSTTLGYAYDKSGNRTQNGSKFFTYDARNQLLAQTSSSISYHYTLRGTLSTTAGAATQHTYTDAFGQVASQDATGGSTSSYTYDGFGRAIQSGMAYSGIGNTLATDGSALYTRDPDDGLLGVSAGSTHLLTLTDQHTDVVGEFTATGTALTGSVSYDPLGSVLASAGMVGHLGYQSEWTDSLTNRVNMAARWYNTDTGQFDSRDSANLSAVGASVTGDRFAYGNDNPMTSTDPSGHMSAAYDDDGPVSRPAPAPKPVVKATYTPPRTGAQGGHVIDDIAPASGCTRIAGQSGPCVKYVNYAAQQAALTKLVASRVAKNDRESEAHEALNTHNAVFFATPAGAQIQQELIDEDRARTAAADAAAAAAAKASQQAQSGSFFDGMWDGVKSFGLGIWHGAADPSINLYNNLASNYNAWQDGTKSGGSALLGGLSALGGYAYSSLSVINPVSQVQGIISFGKDNYNAFRSGDPRRIGAALTIDALTAASLRGGPEFDGLFGKVLSPFRCESFVASTLVLMASGATKAIKDIHVGDKVLAANTQTGTNTAEPVIDTDSRTDTDLADVTVKASKGTDSTIHTTSEHPFWSDDRKAWVFAGQLHVGEHLHSADGTNISVVKVQQWTEAHTMLDLTVNQLHSFYVMAGTTPVLVHNCGGGVDANGNECSCAASGPTNWNPNSRPTFGHTFSEHGAGPKNTRSLTDRARSTGNDQGQWSNDSDAASFLKNQYDPNAGPRQVPLPDGMGTVIRPDGSVVAATHAQLVPGRNGPYKTAFPIFLDGQE